MIKITADVFIHASDIEIIFVRSPGPGGQNVNKLSTSALLRFNVLNAPSIPDNVRARILNVLKNLLTRDGDIVIKASRYRTQERNKQDAIERLTAILKSAVYVPKKRKKTKPTKASQEERLSSKKHHGKTKSLRRSHKSDFSE